MPAPASHNSARDAGRCELRCGCPRRRLCAARSRERPGGSPADKGVCVCRRVASAACAPGPPAAVRALCRRSFAAVRARSLVPGEPDRVPLPPPTALLPLARASCVPSASSLPAPSMTTTCSSSAAAWVVTAALSTRLRRVSSIQVQRPPAVVRRSGLISGRCKCRTLWRSRLDENKLQPHARSPVGLKVAVLDGNDVGGTCVNRGCVPSKALLAASGRVRDMQNAAHLKQLGIHVRHHCPRALGRLTDVWRRALSRRLCCLAVSTALVLDGALPPRTGGRCQLRPRGCR